MERTWETREQLILEAVALAQERSEDPNKAAKAAVPDLRPELYRETVVALGDDEFLDVAVLRGDGTLQSVRIRSIRAKGRRQVKQWPSDDPASELLAALQARLDATEDPIERGRLEQLRDAASTVGKGVLTGLILSVVKSMGGLD